MAREKRYNLAGGVPLWKTPAAVCSACGRYCWELRIAGTADEPGIVCNWCGVGSFIHHGRFGWAWCSCEWRDPYCPECQGTGVVPIPRSIAGAETRTRTLST